MATVQSEYLLARRTRYFTLVACRIGGLLFLFSGGVQVISSLVLPDDGVPYWLLYGLAQTIPGVILIHAQKQIARWVAPPPDLRCLHCDYDAQKSSSERCPECGAMMGIEFRDSRGGSNTGHGPGAEEWPKAGS